MRVKRRSNRENYVKEPQEEPSDGATGEPEGKPHGSQVTEPQESQVTEPQESQVTEPRNRVRDGNSRQNYM